MTNIPEDLLQDIARSSYADMLNDDERNRAYDQAIRICVASLVKSHEHNPHGSRFFKCCDIGTGSGLLSMMIVRAFKELDYDLFSVTAFESFEPMAICAQEVIERSGMSDFIVIVPSSSELVQENPSFDLLVAELLDTELIGEGCLASYRHAVECLCSPTCLFVPYEARIYIEPIASKLLFQRHALDDISVNIRDGNKVQVKVPHEVFNCCGLAVIDDMQVSALKEEVDFERFTKPRVAFAITFNDVLLTSSLADYDKTELDFPILRNITQPIVVVMWWEITMYRTNYIVDHLVESYPIDLEVLSCAPVWARNEKLLTRDKKIRDIYKRDVWREHWIQGIYYFSDVALTRSLPTTTEVGGKLSIFAYRDTHSLWFELSPSDEKLPPNCSCGVHRSLTRSQLAFLNDSKQMKTLFEPFFIGSRPRNTTFNGDIVFQSRPNTKTVLVDDAPKWSITWESSPYKLLDLSFNDEISWEKVLARTLDSLDTKPIVSFNIKFTQVCFENLNRIRTKVGNCEGFDLEPLDRMVGKSSKIIDKALESHHLWEYKTRRLDSDYIICSTSIVQSDQFRNGNYRQTIFLPIKAGLFEYRKGWALVFWAEFKMNYTDEILSTGPIPSTTGDQETIEWNRHCKQLVYFLHDAELTTKETSKRELMIQIVMEGAYIDVLRPIVVQT